MSRIAYVNGRYVDHADARVQVEDRGYQFSDGIYEYIAFYNRRLVDGDAHLRRLARSVGALQIAMPLAQLALMLIIRELIARNGREDGGIYIQITRGVAKRDHPFPNAVKSSLVLTLCGAKLPKAHEVEQGVRVITHPEQRWQRRDIKSISLLANVLAKQEATYRQAREAWLVNEAGMVSEGAVSNAYIVSPAAEIITHPADQHILGGITRETVLTLARQERIAVVERAFTLAEAASAAEAFLTSTSANVLPVVRVDGALIGNGAPGNVTRQLQALYTQHIFEQTGKRL